MRTTGIVVACTLLACLAAGQDGAAPAPRPRQDSWLARQQVESGGFLVPGESEARPGPTGLSLLAFLGAGYTDRENEFADVVRKGVEFLLARQSHDGFLSTDPVEHAQAALALTEIAWMTKDPRYAEPARRALAAIQTDALRDFETCAWSLMALKSGSYAGIEVAPERFEWFRQRILAEKDSTPRTVAMEVLMRIFLGEDPRTSTAVQLGAEVLAQHLPAREAVDETYWYFATLAMFQVGGAHWKKWNEAMVDAVVKRVQPKDSGPLTGSWDPSPACPYGRLGATAMQVMCLLVYYRYDKVFGNPDRKPAAAREPDSAPSTEAIGLGGGAGGAFRGRGGRRMLRASGGGGRAADFHTESYDRIVSNGFKNVWDVDVSTFSIDVDTASYSNMRRFLMQEGTLPPKDAVRVEELINYFDYGYVGPDARAGQPFAANLETGACPWNAKHRLVRVGLQARRVDLRDRPGANLVFLLDVSGSMRPENKLPLVKRAMGLLTEQLDGRDTVAIVVYAGAAGLVLPPTRGDDHAAILGALDRLQAGGSTNGGQGIALAYAQARASYLENGINRVVLCTDGDFNVGTTDRGSLTRLVEEQAKAGVELSICGFGRGNLKDATMEELTNRGNGNYAYVDTINEARKVFVEQLAGTLLTVAKDVKIQVFFNPQQVTAWRLIGYENRLLAKEDFNDDTKDAGEIGAGHSVTALYEIVPAGGTAAAPKADDNPFLERARTTAEAGAGALLRLRLRWKAKGADTSTLAESDVFDTGGGFDEASEAFRWAACVAEFGMLLRDSEHKAGATWDGLLELARGAVGDDAKGYRKEMLTMVARAKELSPAETPAIETQATGGGQ